VCVLERNIEGTVGARFMLWRSGPGPALRWMIGTFITSEGESLNGGDDWDVWRLLFVSIRQGEGEATSLNA